MKRDRTLISLFSGAGGLDYGFERAGFRTGAAVEMDPDCCATLRANRDWPVFEGSIFDVPTRAMVEAAGCARGELDLVVGGPPCQPFSKAGFWAHGETKRLADPRADTLDAYFRVVEDALPRAFVMENVEGLAYAGNEGLGFISARVKEINQRTRSSYIPAVRLVHAADYGVPQLRSRVVIVASRDGAPFSFPPPTHGTRSSGKTQASLAMLEPFRTAWDAIGGLEPEPDEDVAMRGKWAGLLPSIPEGKNYLHLTTRGGGEPLFGWRTRFWSFLLKLAKSQPSWTIQAQPGPSTGPFHWDNRRLSMRELCRIQTFPDDVRITGSYRAIHRQVGNAVPSLMAEVLGRAIRTQLLGERPTQAALSLMPPVRSSRPRARAARPVPPQYQGLAGDHADHPGTGRGPRAQQWLAAE